MADERFEGLWNYLRSLDIRVQGDTVTIKAAGAEATAEVPDDLKAES